MDDKLLKALDKVEQEISLQLQKISNFDFQTIEKKFTNIELNTFLEIFKHSLKAESNNTRILLALAWTYGELECYNDAIEFLERIILIAPLYTDAYIMLFGCYVELGRNEKATWLLKEAIKIKPDDIRMYIMLGLFYHSTLKRCKEAIDVLNDAVKIKPDDVILYIMLGKFYFELDLWKETINVLEQAMKIGSINADSFLCLGMAYLKLNRWNNAIEVMQKAIQIYPNNSPAYCLLGAAYYQINQYDEVTRVYETANKIIPNDAHILLRLGLHYQLINKPNDAIDMLEQLTKIYPEFSDEAYCTLGKLYRDNANNKFKSLKNMNKSDAGFILEEYNKSDAAYKEAIRLNPDSADAHYELGILYVARGNSDSALGEYKILKYLNKDMAEVLFKAIYRQK